MLYGISSSKIPHSFFPFNNTSLGHFSIGDKPVAVKMPSATDNAAAKEYRLVSASVVRGSMMAVNQSPVLLGDSQARPKRPLPPVCDSAVMTVPCKDCADA